MSEEEKSILKTFKEGYGLTKTEERILINLIEKQNTIIKRQSYTNKKIRKTLKTVRKERNKQNKIIYKMAEELVDWYMDNRISNRTIDVQYVIEKFTNKVEEDKE